jgi:long-chain acyl-CoA synthetase
MSGLANPSDAQALPRVHDTVVHMFAEAAARAPRATALICGDRQLSYAQYLRCVGGFAAELVAMGARDGRVALVCGNSIEIAVAMFAVHAAGAQAVPINPIYTARELTHILSDADPTVVIYDAETASVVEPVVAALAIAHAIRVGDGERLLDTWRDDDAAVLPEPMPQAGDLATLQYTGGTTGLPKGVNITHGQLAVNISQREAVLPTLPDDETVLCVMPLFHVFASSMCLHLAAYCRGRLVILPRYHPEHVLAAIAQHRVTRLPAGPTIFIGLMGAEGFGAADLTSLRTAYSGSAPLPEEALKRWEAATGCPILEGYGQSEAGPVLTYIGEAMAPKPGSVGPPLPQTDIQIVDVETGTRVRGTGEIGEIRARGPQIMSGYRNCPDETAQALRDGWLYTGDIGEFDADGYLTIRDRKKDMVITGGYNVYPREIDEVLYAHDEVLEAAAVGVPDDYRGEVIKAYVALKPGARATAQDLRAHCEANLAKYKVPADIEIVPEVAKTTVGKIDKKALRTTGGEIAR